MADISGADPAFVPTASSQEVVSTEGFNRGEVPRVAFVVFKDAYMRCPVDSWDQRVIDGLTAAAEYLPKGPTQ